MSLPHGTELGQVLLDVGRHFTEVMADTSKPGRLLQRGWQSEGVPMPPELLERLTQHSEAVCGLLVRGHEPDGEAGAVLDAALLAFASGAPDVLIKRGSPAWLVLTGMSMGGTWPNI